MTNDEIWQAVLGELELSISKANFTTWFKNTFVISFSDEEVIIGVPNAFTKEWLENKYHKNIFRALQNVTNARLKKVTYEIATKKIIEPKSAPDIEEKIEEKAVSIATEEKAEAKIDSTTNLNKRYIFKTFIVGSSNELARAAALAVAGNPGTSYNPLFIYGGVGLGKTHLLQAIGNEVLRKYPKKKIVYVTSEKFTEDFINFIQKEKGRANHLGSTFKDKYRSADVLLIDDIQFLSGKEGTQEEFFHTFNTLYQNNKQVVLTSDRPPKAIAGLEDRLVSRFEGGMIADIGLPDLETRRAILDTKCKDKNITLSSEIIDYIASNIQHNIRELEGALSRVVAYKQLNNSDPDIETVKKILTNIISDPKRKAVTPKQILEAVANFYDIKVDALIAKNRKKEIAWPRQIAMYLMREETKTSYPTIGQEIGGRDHTTAMHACDKVNTEIEGDENLRQEVDLIRQRIYIPAR